MRGSLLGHSQFETGCFAHAAQEQKAGLHSSGSGVHVFGLIDDAKQSSQSSIPHFPASRFSHRVLQSPVSSPLTGKAGNVVSQRASRSHKTSQASSGVTDAGVGLLGAGFVGAGSAGTGPNRTSSPSVFAALVFAGSSKGAVSTTFPPHPRTKRSHIVDRMPLHGRAQSDPSYGVMLARCARPASSSRYVRGNIIVVSSRATSSSGTARSALSNEWRPRQDSNLPQPV